MTTNKSHVVDKEPIAIVGVSALFPGSVGARGFWSDILRGRDLLTEVPASHWLLGDYYDPDPLARDKTYANRGGFLPDVEFDPMAFGIPPSSLPSTDTSQLLALIVAQQVLEDASRGDLRRIDRDRTSVILGVTSAQELLGSMVSRLQRPVWSKALREMGLPESDIDEACERIAAHYVEWQESSFPGLLGNVVAGRIANRLDLGGTNCVCDAACASTFSALAMAVNELHLGHSDLVITGGVDTMNDIFMYVCFSKTPALSRSGDCRPFSDKADGTMLGEGLGLVALKRLSDAEAAGDPIYAVIRGVGSSSDGRAKSVYAPVPEGQAKALRRAYEQAGFTADSVELVEAHGTGTMAGDAAEFAGLRLVFEDTERFRAGERQFCALGSVKSQIGHTKSAAGAAGLFKAVMALHHKVLPPTVKIDRPNPKLTLEASPFHLSTTTRPWIRDARHPRRAGVSAFGFGGSNFHVALEEYTGESRAAALRTSRSELVVLAADGRPALAEACRALAVEVRAMLAAARDTEHENEASVLQHVALRTQRAAPSGTARAAVVAESASELCEKLAEAAELAGKPGLSSTPRGVLVSDVAADGSVCFLFPGQGSQYLGMGLGLAAHVPVARAVWDQAAGVAPLHDVVFPKPGFSPEHEAAALETLTRTEWAQPAIGAASLATLAALQHVGLRAAMAVGHSFGEVTALCAAEALSVGDALRVARQRGERMAEAAAQPGAMCAVLAPKDEVTAALEGSGIAVVLANHNSPRELVLSGATDEIERAMARCKERGLDARRLKVATAFHSPIVASAVGPFGRFLGDVPFGAPRFPVLANATAAAYPTDAAEARRLLATQLENPVRFVESIEAAWAAGARTFVEVGPGTVLTGLVGRILDGRPHHAIATDKKGKDALTSLHEALGRLFVLGISVDVAALFAGYGEARDPRSVPAPKMAVRINGSNYGKIHPPNPPGTKGKAIPARARATALPAPALAPAATPDVALASSTTLHPTDDTTEPFEGDDLGTTMKTDDRTPAPHAYALADDAAEAAPLPDDVQLAWVAAYQEAQRQTVEAHVAFQETMSQSHQAFLRAQEAGFAGLAALLTGAPLPTHTVAPLPAPRPAPQLAARPVARPTPAPARVAAAPAAPAAVAAVAAAVPVAPAVAAPAVAAPAAPVPAPVVAAKAPAAVDLEKTMLEVVSTKTGYPVEMLGADMDLEADLGVDSIKRVEILAGLRERTPNMPELDMGKLGAMRTLAQIVAYVREVMGVPAAVATPAAPAPAAPPAPVAKAANGHANGNGNGHGHAPAADLEKTMLEVVAAKTGYPVEMLGADMDLESDLGVDSIKRVEILAAMRERTPNLPELDMAKLGALRTLAQIVGHMREVMGGSGATRLSPKAEAPTAKGIGRWVTAVVEAPALGFALPGLLGCRRCVVTDDGGGLAPALVAVLARRGVAAEVALDVPADADAVVLLDALRPMTADVEGSLALHHAGLRAARTVAKTMTTRGAFVTVQDTGGDFGLRGSTRAALGGLTGLVKTAAQEWPAAGCRAVDLERGGRSPEALAEVLADELLAGGTEVEVGLAADGRRRTVISRLDPLDAGEVTLPAGSVVVVSGGARGVTAACVLALVKETRCKVLVLARTPLAAEPAGLEGARTDAELKKALLGQATARGEKLSPAELTARVNVLLGNREVQGTLAQIRAAGGDVRYEALDVTDAASVAAVLADVRASFGPIAGVIHGAGVIADKLIAEKTDAQAERVLSTKVRGLFSLLAATERDALRFFVCFSSVAGRAGNRGQCDYAMANEVLNKVSCLEQTRRPDCVFKSLGWGPWESGMVSPALRAHFEAAGVPLVSLVDGPRAMLAEIAAGGPVDVVIGAEPKAEALVQGGARPPREATHEVLVDRRTHPFVDDHRVKGQAVVPVVMAVEWFARAARALAPEAVLASVHDLRVLRGIRLVDFDGKGDRFVVRVRETSPDGLELAAEVLGAGGARHYTARLRLASATPAPAPPFSLGGARTAWAHPVYGDQLFHGPQFQVIRGVPVLTPEGIEGELVGANAAGWSGQFLTDPAMLDGGLQLAVTFAKQATGGASLPTAFSALRWYGAPSGAVRCVVRSRALSKDHTVSDLVFLEDERVVAELEGVEVHVLPGTRDAATATPIA